MFAAAVAATFGLVALVFFVYDVMVHQRNENLVINAAQSNAILSGLFPGQLRDRLLNENKEAKQNAGNKAATLKSFLHSDHKDANGASGPQDASGTQLSKPLADLFLETTVSFTDIVGKLKTIRAIDCPI